MAEAMALVADLPATYAHVLTGASGRERHPDLAWSVTAYVCHVGGPVVTHPIGG